jgi:hypothetical protein
LLKLAEDPRFVGGLIDMMGILHTWTRDLFYHPHIHYLVPGGGISFDRKKWLPSAKNFLVPVKALSPIFRAKFRDELQKNPLFDQVKKQVWDKDWVGKILSWRQRGSLLFSLPFFPFSPPFFLLYPLGNQKFFLFFSTSSLLLPSNSFLLLKVDR